MMNLKLIIMKNLKTLFLFPLFLLGILFTGCEKDSTVIDQNQQAAEYHVKTITVPDAMTQSSDPGAQMAVAYINMVNSMSSYATMMNPPDEISNKSLKSDEESFTWVVDDGTNSYTVLMKTWESDYKTVWEMYITGIMEGHSLDNFKYIEAIQLSDGSSSTFTVYDLDTGEMYMDFTWLLYEDNSLDATFTVFNESKIHMLINQDGSGSLEFSEWIMSAFWNTYKAQWDTTGHGQYWEYDDGVETNQGSW